MGFTIPYAVFYAALMCLIMTFSNAVKAKDYETIKKRPLTQEELEIESRIDVILSKMTQKEKVEQLQPAGMFHTKDNKRLGIPGFQHADGPHGVRDGKATAFPVGLGVASTWDVDLVDRLGVALGKEMRAKGKNSVLAPCIDLVRDPRAGRNQETAGEDPYLASRVGVSWVKGIQSVDAIATIKHFNLNTKEKDRMENNDIIDERGLVEHYGLAFRKAVEEADARSVMAAYTGINGDYSTANKWLLTDVLKGLFGFRYYVVSDWAAVHDGLAAFNAGTDLDAEPLPWVRPFAPIEKWIASGKATQERLNDAVRRILRAKIASKMLDEPMDIPKSVVNSKEHQELALEAAQKSIVLLKNDKNILPLDKGLKIALIGPNASDDRNLLGDTGSSAVTPFYTVNVFEGMKEISEGKLIKYAKGCNISGGLKLGFGVAKRIASDADVVVFVGGLNHSQEGEAHVSGDRKNNSIDLPGHQMELIEELSEVNSNIVLVLIGGSAIGINKVIDKVDAVVMGWYPGQEGGKAIAQILYGDVNPSGKLAMTFPKTDSDLPSWNDDHSMDIIEGRGYRWYDHQKIKPEFAFGHGLSYTDFSYEDLSIEVNGYQVNVSVTVKNTGDRFGSEVVQLYLSDLAASVVMPEKQLKGFIKADLEPQEEKRITFQLTRDEMSFYDVVSQTFVVEPGQFEVMVGGASDSLPLKGQFHLSE